MPSRYFLGVDGGGTSTRALIVDENGIVVGRGQGGPANPNIVGTAAMIGELHAAIDQAARAAKIGNGSVVSAFFGIAGTASAPDREKFPALFSAIPVLSAAKIVVDHDLRIAHAAALGGQPGIIIIAGTGSAAFARSEAGDERICGGGGPLIDDVGSGFWIALKGLQAAFASAEDRAPKTTLLPSFLEHLKLSHYRDLAVTATKSSRDSLAGLAPVVFAAAETGDAVASAILDAGATELCLLARSLQANLFKSSPTPVSLCGGLSQVPEYRARVVSRLQSDGSKFSFLPSSRPPVDGAVILAAQRAGLPAFSQILEKADARPT